MKVFLLFLTYLVISLSASAQSAEDSIKVAVNNLFTAMKEANPELLKSCFADSAVLQTIVKNKQGQTVVTNEKVEDFVEFIRKETKGNADERISFETIKIDGPLAIVWTPYNFYYKGNFSHCGVNSFQLVRFGGIWKIQYLIDTRRRAGCKP